jgi:hypothetical protein
MPNGNFNQFAKPLATRVSLGVFSSTEGLILVGAGIVAACALAFVPTPLRIPGHAILKAALPIACGVALVSRPLSGTVASTSGMLTSTILMLAGIGHLPAAAIVSLVSFGPAVDFALRKASGKGSTIFCLAIAGLGANLLAFSARWGSALYQNDLLHSLSARQFLTSALFSFVLCGLAAGVIAGLFVLLRRRVLGISP